MEINSTGARLGFRAFQRFYDLTVNSKKQKSTDEFINSAYYIDFVKFGNHLALLKPLHTEQYIDYVIMNGVKLKDWTKDFVYEFYIENLVKKEPASSATDRTITNIMEWCDLNNEEFSEFFSKVSTNEAAYLIKTGKISPWVLYLSASGGNLMDRFNDDHSRIIGAVIDPGEWKKKFKKNEEDVDFIRNLLEQARI